MTMEARSIKTVLCAHPFKLKHLTRESIMEPAARAEMSGRLTVEAIKQWARDVGAERVDAHFWGSPLKRVPGRFDPHFMSLGAETIYIRKEKAA